MSPGQTTANDRLEALRVRLSARAAGWWRVAHERLEQVAFSSCDDMPVAVARAFADATRSVALTQTDLGIVKAALTGEVAVSRHDETPPDAGSGSGFWLRRFGATRSVAVPVRDASGTVVRVVSVALPDGPADETAVARAIRAEASGWPSSVEPSLDAE